MSTTTPVSIGDSEDVVIQLRKELDSLKKEVDTMKLFLTKEVDTMKLFLTKEVASLKSDYKRDIEILRQDLDKEHTKAAGLQVELEHLSKMKGFQ